jgi:hypothetical protein
MAPARLDERAALRRRRPLGEAEVKLRRFDIAAGLEALGAPGVVGIGLLMFTLAFLLGALRPAYGELLALREREARALQRPPRTDAPGGGVRDAAADLAKFERWLPAADEARQELLRLQSFAERHGLQLQRGEYRAARQGELAVLRHQVQLPVKGEYADIRGFVTEALAELPSLALDAASLQRETASAKEIEGRLQYSLYTAGS